MRNPDEVRKKFAGKPNVGGRPSRSANEPMPTKGKKRSARSAKEAGQRHDIPVVGIGASAGGIEALSRFFEAMPADSGLAFVVVLHLDPTRESQVASVLGSRTSMPVAEIVNGMRIEPNRVYVIVPDRSLTVRGDRLHLARPAESRGHRYPVDVLFSSLAADRKERMVAIVLSGSGSDGSHGLREVKAKGGLILVQDPETAGFDGMPRAAIAVGVADRVLAPENMPEALRNYVKHGYMEAPGRIDGAVPGESSSLDPILALLRTRAGHDFRNYKRSTLERRIHRRMGLGNLQSVADYACLLRDNPKEISSLVRDLMINVSGFFRDPEAWNALAESVIAPLLAKRQADAEVRFWVPACATGEEAYSLAMLAIECAEAARKRIDLKIFATDAQEENLKVARNGVYPQAATMALAPARRRRFFEKLDNAYRVKTELREMVVFAPQNLLCDPPFSRLDLVSCRNLLIYLDPEAQKRVLALLHFALRDGGHLFLGNAETVGRRDDLFETVSKKWRIYRRIGRTRHDLIDFPLLGKTRAQHPDERQNPDTEVTFQVADLARQELLERYAPASVLIDRKGRILYFHGSTGDYLAPPAGEPTRDVVAMARDGLRPRLRGAIRQAFDTHQGVSFAGHVRQADMVRPVSVTVAPLAAARTEGDLLLVSFQPIPELPATASDSSEVGTAHDLAEQTLEQELKAVRAELQNTVEQMESTNEELKAANEEVTSMNEELQSTNEELETSKEELQSFNEELHTVNSQLQHKIKELENVTDDQRNFLAATDIATIFLDKDFCITWFSPVSAELLHLLPSDLGRPLKHFARKFIDDKLLVDAEAVLNKLVRLEAEIRSDAGRWYLRRLLPYRTHDSKITGVVLTFTDITEIKRAADVVNEERLYTRAIVETIRQPLLVVDGGQRVVSANRAFYALFQVAAAETENRLIYEIGNRQWDIPSLRVLLEQRMSREDSVENFVVEHEFEKIGHRAMLLNARRLSRGGGPADLTLLAIEDITERRQAEAQRDVLIAELSHRVKNVLATVQAIASLTLRQGASLEEFRISFGARLRALASAHDLLVGEHGVAAELGQLIDVILDPYRGENLAQIRTSGPKLVLPPRNGVALVMVLHELATNAAKYGALARPEGRLDVTWRLEPGKVTRIRLSWTEAGCAPMKKPSGRGFGTRLIEDTVAHELRGESVMNYRRDGLNCELTFPWEETTSLPAPKAS